MLKQRIAAKETIIGSFVFLSSPEMVEIMALAGMDYIIIDTEHSPKDWSTLEHMIRAANLHGLPALIRVSDNNEKLILQCLEIGADGLVIPFVQSGADVRVTRDAMYYPPHGNRGTCTLTRNTGYGARRADFLEHCQAQFERLVLFAQVEDVEGVDNIEQILAEEPGVDAILVGRADLASSLGSPGDVQAPAVLEATDRLLEAVSKKNDREVAAAMGIYSGAEVGHWKERGCTVFFAPSDGILAFNAAKAWCGEVRGS